MTLLPIVPSTEGVGDVDVQLVQSVIKGKLSRISAIKF